MNSRDFFYEFGRLLYLIDGFYDEFAKKSGVKPNLLWLLYALNDGKEHSQCEICQTWALPRSTINTITTELKEAGIIQLKQIKGKRRELSVSLTEKGKKYADGLLKNLYGIEQDTFESVRSDAVTTVNCLQNIVKYLDAHK